MVTMILILSVLFLSGTVRISALHDHIKRSEPTVLELDVSSNGASTLKSRQEEPPHGVWNNVPDFSKTTTFRDPVWRWPTTPTPQWIGRPPYQVSHQKGLVIPF